MINKVPDTIAFVFFGVVVGALGYATMHTQKGRQLQEDVLNVVDDFITLAEMVFDDDIAYDNTVSSAYGFMNKTFAKIDSYLSSDRTSEAHTSSANLPEKNVNLESKNLDLELLKKLGRKNYRANKTYSIISG